MPSQQITKQHVLSNLHSLQEVKPILLGFYQQKQENKKVASVFDLFHLFMIIHYFEKNQTKVNKRNPRGQLEAVKWLRFTDLLIFLSDTVIITIHLENLFSTTKTRSDFGKFAQLETRYIDNVTTRPLTFVPIVLKKPHHQKTLTGLLFWLQHEFEIKDISVKPSTSRRISLSDFIRDIYRYNPHMETVILQTYLHSIKDFQEFLKSGKEAIQDELRDNLFMKSALSFLRSWPTVRPNPKESADAYQTFITRRVLAIEKKVTTTTSREQHTDI